MSIFFMDEEMVGQEQWMFALHSLERNRSADLDSIMMMINTQHNIQTQILISQTYKMESSTQPHLDSPITIAESKKKKVDYQKNICAYVTKKVVQCLLSYTYRRTVEKLCRLNHCQYHQVKSYYEEMKGQGFGITLLSVLITPQNEQEIQIKKVFRSFLRWFLRGRYMLYLMKQGKMQDKDKYIQFKNKYLLYIEEQDTNLRISESHLNRSE